MFSYLKQILYLLGSDKRKLPFLIILFIGASMLDLAGLGLIGPYVALVVNPGALDGKLGQVFQIIGLPRDQQSILIIIGLSLFIIFLLKAISSIGIHWVIIRFSQQQQLRLKSYLMQTYQALPYTEYLKRNSSEYIYNIQNLTGQFSEVVLTLLRSTSDAIVGLVILTLLAFTNGPALAFLASLMAVIVYSYDRLFRKNLKRYGLQINIANTAIVQGIHEGIEGLKEIRVLGHEGHFLRKVQDGFRRISRYQARKQVIQAAPRYLLELIMISFVVILVVGVQMLGQNFNALLPTLGVFSVAALRLLPMTNFFSISFVQLRFSRDGVSRLHQDLARLKQIQLENQHDSQNGQAVSGPPNIRKEPFRKLELKKLTFRYPNANCNALEDISIQINNGESVGLIGPSGAGKTTLVDVLLGLLQPQSGEMQYNGKRLNESLSNWRAQAAYLPQDVFLIDNTLRSNVALGVDINSIDEDRLNEALAKARLKKLVDQLPQGVDSLLGERGVRLSGGQRQRVALARAFYHRRNVLVMDEATSSLDDETEREIVAEIQRLKGQITMIVIAHRFSTVQHCDRIYKLDEGRIVDQGSFDAVINKKANINA
uniref:ABC transporter related protein n=1 Tax=uncultured marine thaumarchaeote KM3_87_H02 TaxID=1456331 RepID=A0A075HU69_9ARCH|nr:ABC transporter related protein [uncultured marine thaumarchaeote KM3_87_H02]